MDLTTATPAKIDTALGDIYGRYYTLQGKIGQHTKWLKEYDEGLAKKAANPNRGTWSSYTDQGRAALVFKRARLVTQAQEVLEETLPYEEEYVRRGGWSRFYMVKNNGGHIHSSQRCTTCYVTTQFGWLPSVSGQTEAEAVAEFGAILCTVCFPSAPTEYTDRHDDSVCPGSGKYYNNDLPKRTGFYTGNWATCEGCGEHITISSAGKIRKHKKS